MTTPKKIIAEALFLSNFGGTNDSSLEELALGVAESDAVTAVKALEDAGYRIIKEPTEAMILSAARKHVIIHGYPDALLSDLMAEMRLIFIAAFSDAPIWGDK